MERAAGSRPEAGDALEREGAARISVGFVGLGNMGSPMVRRLVAAGHRVWVHDARPEAAREHAETRWAESPAQLATRAPVVLLSLPGPPQVEAVVAGPDGLLSALPAGAVIVDLSTNSLRMVRRLAEQCARRQVHFLDSPVSGGAAGSQAGSLVLMVGGEAGALERARPLLECLSRMLVHLGEVGAGTMAKLVHNQLYLCGEVLFYEALVLAAKAGLDASALLEILSATGAGGVHARLAPRLLNREFDPATFALSLAEKDLGLVLEVGRELGVPLPTSSAAYQLFVEAAAKGLQGKNFWAAFELAEERAGVRVRGPGELA